MADLTNQVTFRIDVNAIDDSDRVGTSLRAAIDVEGAYEFPPVVGNLAYALDSDGNICLAKVDQIESNGFVRLQLFWHTWRQVVTFTPTHQSFVTHGSVVSYQNGSQTAVSD